jgi:hypothetical protein
MGGNNALRWITHVAQRNFWREEILLLFNDRRIKLGMFQGRSIGAKRLALEHSAVLLQEHPDPLIAAERRASVEAADRLVFHFPLGTTFFQCDFQYHAVLISVAEP